MLLMMCSITLSLQAKTCLDTSRMLSQAHSEWVV